MVDKKKIGERIVALWLFALLMLPTAAEFMHTFEDHEPFSCSETSTHIHNLKAECELCDTLLTTFNYDLTTYQELALVEIPVKKEVIFASLQLHSFKITNTQLRAPPLNS